MTGGEVAQIIDHTLLRPDATRQDIEALCREALAFGFAAVCINPAWVPAAVRALAGSGVAVCTVAGFPLGATTTTVKEAEAGEATGHGAREIDMVLNVGWLKGGSIDDVRADIDAVVSACRRGNALCKVIIEAALLTDREKVLACELAKAAGAAFVKTSTGFGPGGAVAADVALMRRAVGAEMGIKAAGGIRDLATLERMVAAGATRIGTSAGVTIVGEKDRTDDSSHAL
jgi:deoxyribose-phosphate aldolase